MRIGRFDHRAIDGARLMQAFMRLVERRTGVGIRRIPAIMDGTPGSAGRAFVSFASGTKTARA